MAGTLKKVRFIRAFQSYRVGAEITPNGSLRQWLVENGYAEIVPESGSTETAKAGKSPVDRQLKVPSKRSQGGGLL